MYEYLQNHSYISKNKKSNYQFELSEERASCIVGKYNTLVEEKDKEIERLTAESTEWESKFYDEAKKVDKAIEYIETNCILSDVWEEKGFCNFVPIGKIEYKPLSTKKVKELLKILKGEYNENN